MVWTLVAPSIHSKQDFKLAILPKRVSAMDVWKSDMPPLRVLVCFFSQYFGRSGTRWCSMCCRYCTAMFCLFVLFALPSCWCATVRNRKTERWLLEKQFHIPRNRLKLLNLLATSCVVDVCRPQQLALAPLSTLISSKCTAAPCRNTTQCLC